MSQESKTLKNIGELQISGVQVISTQQTAITDVAAATVQALTLSGSGAGGTDILAGITQSNFNDNSLRIATEINSLRVDAADIRTQINDLLAKLRTHGLIAN